MLQDDLALKSSYPYSGPNPFAEAILSFIDEMKNDKERRSIFYKQVVQAACQLYLADDSPDRNLVSATQLSNYITEIESQHRKRSIVRKVFVSAQPLVEGLMQYTAAIDTMIQADPTASALIYGGAKLVLQLASGYIKYFEQITQMMADIGVQLQYFHIYTREFATEKYMSGILCNSYRDILLFWRDSSKILNQKGKRFLAGGLFVPFNERYAKFKQKLDKNAQNVRHMAQALHIQKQGNFSRTQALQVRDLVTVLDQPISTRPPNYQEVDTKHDAVKRWISGGRFSRINPEPDLERHLSSRHEGTAEWIFDDPAFTKWKRAGESASLWVNAAPGSGKSVLCASIIDNVKQTEKKDHGNVIYFFCRFDDPDKCKAASALKSLAIQALKLTKYIPDELFELYQEEFSVDDRSIANISVAEQALGCILRHIPYVSVIIDGLDECTETTLLESLIRLRDQRAYGISKWLFTSRNDAVIRKKLESFKWDILTAPKKVIQNDIRKFLRDNSELICATCDQLDKISEMSQGNFLMMRLTIDPFRNEELTCAEEFDDALDDFKPELSRCWFRSLHRLIQRSEQIQALAQFIFTAIILAAQPMTFNELQDLLSVKVGEEPSSKRRRSRSVILSAFSPFIEVDYDDDVVNPTLRLVHKSIGDFLTQDPAQLDFVTKDCYKFFVKSTEGNTEIGKRCLTYLSYKRYANLVNLDFDGDPAEHGLLKYASIFWHNHLQRAGASRELYNWARDFMKSPNYWTCVRVQGKFAPHMFAKLSYNSKTDSYKMSLPSTTRAITAGDFFASALPEWIEKYDDQGDFLVWGYHTFVREWSEVLVRNPDKIEQYFAKVIGKRSFWDTETAFKQLAEVSSAEGETDVAALLKSSQGNQDSTVSSQALIENSTMGAKTFESDYVVDVLKKQGGEWKLHDCVNLHMGHFNATVHQYKLQESDDTDDSGEENSDDEDDKDASNIEHKNVMWFLSIFASEEEKHWYHHVTPSTLQRSLPIFVPHRSLLIWPQSELSTLIIDTRTWKSSTFTTLPTSEKTHSPLVSQDLHYVFETNTLYRASIYTSKRNIFAIKHTSFPITPSEISLAYPSQETTWRCTSRCFNPPISFSWQGAALYAAVGSPKVKILRFPALPTTHSAANSEKIQILKTRIFIPSSSYSRELRFRVYTDSNTNACHALFTLNAEPKFELPAVILDFKLNPGDWKDYDPEERDADEKLADMADFLKGEYASKEQAFSVPIRSGLDWRRSVYVTCW